MSAAPRALGGPLVHGMGAELVEPDWPPLGDLEVRSVLEHYERTGGYGPGDDADITWHSPRPMSAAGLVCWAGTTVFIKRHDKRVRTAGQLAVEHAFARHLRDAGVAIPAVLRTARGKTTVVRGESVYEVHEVAGGADVYRNATSWTPFTSLGHAWAAGAALARLHQASVGFDQPPRPPGVLINSCEVITARDPIARVARLLQQRPGLARYLAQRPWQDDLARYHAPVVRRVAPLLAALRPQWGHGDWHPSNLSWTSAEPGAGVAGVFDLGLANRTFVVHDLGVALERSTVSWLDLTETGRAQADLDVVRALLDGYQATGPLGAGDLTALAELMPIVHMEYALSEVEYFADVVRSARNADLAYDTYFIGHTRWFEGPDGSALLDCLRRR
jgi:Ser/Thr protein kinase RdoA (MazF antagonist)